MHKPRSGFRAEKGAALLTTVIILGMLTALAAAYAANVRSNVALRGANSIERLGFYTAEGGLNVGVTRFANIFRDAGVPEGSDFHQEVTIGDRTADVTLATVSGCDPCPPTVVPQGELFAGLNSIPYRYTVQSLSINEAGDTEAHVAGQFDIHTVPIFQFLAFIDDHLFIMPLPNMTLHGRLHSNSRIYLQPDNTLKVEDLRPQIPEVQITASDRIYRGGRKYDSTWNCTGTVSIDKLEDKVSPFNDLDPKTLACVSGTSPVPDSTLSAWKGSMKQDVTNIVTPDVGIINRGSSEYWQNADLRIVLRLDQARATVDFGALDLCPAPSNGVCSNSPSTVCTTDAACGIGNTCTRVSPSLYQIEVQNADGTQNVDKTRKLWRFMCERRGALFYTDVPINGPPTPPANNSAFISSRLNYLPTFAASNRVYRRVGEDTSGNGVISANVDRNDAICPPGAPWYQPPDCAQVGRNDAGTWYNDLDYRRGAFWNHRELQYMYLLNINVRALIEWNQVNLDPFFAHNDTTDGGLVFFFSVAGPDQNANVNSYGVRIFDSADLDTRNVTFPTSPAPADPTGLTIVSDQAVIIQGNYNYRDKQPAAILSDAQFVLSQGWEVPIDGFPNDLKSVFDLATDRRDVPASDTILLSEGGGAAFNTSTALGINAALLFGLGPSTLNADYYNGGLENFPRFLESWSSRTMNYRGSFVSLGRASHKLANWPCGSGTGCYAGVYDPPVRAYDYDGDFNTVEKLPPMTPKIVYVQQLLYTRIFN
jgi:hypothetical protein